MPVVQFENSGGHYPGIDASHRCGHQQMLKQLLRLCRLGCCNVDAAVPTPREVLCVTSKLHIGRLQPCSLECSLQAAWCSCLQDESGTATAMFPQAAGGFRDFKVNDDDLVFSVGNRGSYVVVVPQ